jgi:hypothetical protein
MAWITEGEFREKHVSSNATEISSASVEDALKAAEDFIVRKCGESVRSFVEDEAEANAGTPKYRALRDAQECLTVRKMLLNSAFTSRLQDGGVFESAKDLNDTTVTTKFESFSRETEARRAALYLEAMELIEPFLYSVEIVADLLSDNGETSRNVPVRYVF